MCVCVCVCVHTIHTCMYNNQQNYEIIKLNYKTALPPSILHLFQPPPFPTAVWHNLFRQTNSKKN